MQQKCGNTIWYCSFFLQTLHKVYKQTLKVLDKETQTPNITVTSSRDGSLLMLCLWHCVIINYHLIYPHNLTFFWETASKTYNLSNCCFCIYQILSAACMAACSQHTNMSLNRWIEWKVGYYINVGPFKAPSNWKLHVNNMWNTYNVIHIICSLFDILVYRLNACIRCLNMY